MGLSVVLRRFVRLHMAPYNPVPLRAIHSHTFNQSLTVRYGLQHAVAPQAKQQHSAIALLCQQAPVGHFPRLRLPGP